MNGSKNSLFRKCRTKCQNEFHFFENITSKTKQSNVQKLPNTAAIGTRVSDLGDFWTTLKNQLANTPRTNFGHIRIIIAEIGGNVAYVTHFPTWNREKARANTCEGREMPWGRRLLGSLFGKSWNQYQYKSKAQKSNQYKEIRGKPVDFGEKAGKFDTYTFGWRRKLRGENFEPRKTSPFGTKHAHRDTIRQRCVCTNTKAHRFPLCSDSESLPAHQNTTKKSHRKLIYHHEASKTRTKSNKRTKAAKALLAVKAATIAATDVGRGIFDVLSSSSSSSPTPRNGRSFPPSESSQRSINSKTFIIFKGWSMFCWFSCFRCHRNRPIAHTYS